MQEKFRVYAKLAHDIAGFLSIVCDVFTLLGSEMFEQKDQKSKSKLSALVVMLCDLFCIIH